MEPRGVGRPVTLWGQVASQGPEREITLAEIEVGERLRGVGDGAVADLMVSITETGLIQPIVVRPFERSDGEIGLRLVAGAHRLEAHRRLGRETIRARIVDLSDLDARQAEIDENIVRAAPEGWERIEFIAQRAKVWAERHPEAVKGPGEVALRGKGRPRKDHFSVGRINGVERYIPSIMGFVAEVSDQTGLKRTALYQDCQIWAALHGYADQIRTLPAARDTRALRQIVGQPEDRRGDIISALADGRAKTVSDAISIAAGATPIKLGANPQDQAVKAFRALWSGWTAEQKRAVARELEPEFLKRGWRPPEGDADA